MAEREAAEALGEGDEPVVVELLVAQEHDLVIEQRLTDDGNGLVARIGGGVDAVDLSSEPAGDPADGGANFGTGGHVGSFDGCSGAAWWDMPDLKSSNSIRYWVFGIPWHTL